MKTLKVQFNANSTEASLEMEAGLRETYNKLKDFIKGDKQEVTRKGTAKFLKQHRSKVAKELLKRPRIKANLKSIRSLLSKSGNKKETYNTQERKALDVLTREVIAYLEEKNKLNGDKTKLLAGLIGGTAVGLVATLGLIFDIDLDQAIDTGEELLDDATDLVGDTTESILTAAKEGIANLSAEHESVRNFFINVATRLENTGIPSLVEAGAELRVTASPSVENYALKVAAEGYNALMDMTVSLTKYSTELNIKAEIAEVRLGEEFTDGERDLFMLKTMLTDGKDKALNNLDNAIDEAEDLAGKLKRQIAKLPKMYERR